MWRAPTRRRVLRSCTVVAPISTLPSTSSCAPSIAASSTTHRFMICPASPARIASRIAPSHPLDSDTGFNRVSLDYFPSERRHVAPLFFLSGGLFLTAALAAFYFLDRRKKFLMLFVQTLLLFRFRYVNQELC